MTNRRRRFLSRLLLPIALAARVSPAVAQFEGTPVPEAMSVLDFMLGEGAVEGEFRTPDHVAADRTLGYLTQPGFALLLDEGRTSGSAIIFFDTAREAWVSTGVHAPSNTIDTSVAPRGEGVPVFEGRGTHRRGERIFRRRYELHGPDEYRIVTDVSFDDGETWIDEQIVHLVRRRP